MCTDQASGLDIVPRRHGYDPINERMPPAVSAGHCGNQNKRKNSSNPSAAWVNDCTGSPKFGGVLFVAYSNDHWPRHVHGFAGETEAIIDLRLDGTVA